jgi:Domain of unknown function DUF11/RTX calcium-binding nonapeptide repeat (4 copies)
MTRDGSSLVQPLRLGLVGAAVLVVWLALPGEADAACPPPPAGPTPPDVQCVDLVLDKSDSPDPVNVGNEVHYRIDVINAPRYQAFVPPGGGPPTAEQPCVAPPFVPALPPPAPSVVPNSCDGAFGNAIAVTITDNLPPGTQFVSATPNPPLPGASCSHSAGVVTCTPRVSSVAPPGVIPPGLTAGVEITVRTTETGTITNTATIASAVSTEVDPPDNTESVNTTVQVPGPPPGGARQPGKTTCKGKTATIVDEAGDGSGVVKGTVERDVIVGLGGKDKIKAGGGPDLICGGPGGDLIKGARGDDKIKGGKGRDVMRGGAGADDCKGGAGRDSSSRC